MTIDLKEALVTVDALLVSMRGHAGTGKMRACCYEAAANAEALGVVLAAARENHAAALVARVQQTTAEVFAGAPHGFAGVVGEGVVCRKCLGRESDPVHVRENPLL